MWNTVKKWSGSLVGKCVIASVGLHVLFRFKQDDPVVRPYELPLIALVIILLIGDTILKNFDTFVKGEK